MVICYLICLPIVIYYLICLPVVIYYLICLLISLSTQSLESLKSPISRYSLYSTTLRSSRLMPSSLPGRCKGTSSSHIRSNCRQTDCLFNSLFRLATTNIKYSLCEGNQLVTGGFLSLTVWVAESGSIALRYHVQMPRRQIQHHGYHNKRANYPGSHHQGAYVTETHLKIGHTLLSFLSSNELYRLDFGIV